MKAKHLISVILLSGVVMGTGFCSNDNQQKIRSKFNIEESYCAIGNDSNLLIVFYVQIMPDDLVMQLHRF